MQIPIPYSLSLAKIEASMLHLYRPCYGLCHKEETGWGRWGFDKVLSFLAWLHHWKIVLQAGLRSMAAHLCSPKYNLYGDTKYTSKETCQTSLDFVQWEINSNKPKKVEEQFQLLKFWQKYNSANLLLPKPLLRIHIQIRAKTRAFNSLWLEAEPCGRQSHKSLHKKCLTLGGRWRRHRRSQLPLTFK